MDSIIVNEESYLFTNHALTVIAERELSVEWIKTTLAAPERTEIDKHDPLLLHVLKRIPEYEQRVLRRPLLSVSSPLTLIEDKRTDYENPF